MGVFPMININNAVQFQHLLWDRIMKQAKIVVDATCGNGHDLLYLVERASIYKKELFRLVNPCWNKKRLIVILL